MLFRIPTKTDSMVQFLFQFANAGNVLSTAPLLLTELRFILEANRTTGGAAG
jgi:hypothetical protein